MGEQAKAFREMLAAERTEEIDFDRLAAWLESVEPELRDAQARSEDLALLRQDYEGRIAGMAKAMAAVDRSGKGYEVALTSLETLSRMSGEELVACYRKTAARFRDMFPTSFGLRPGAMARGRAADMSVYK
ncbi:hypothetical protein C3F09_10710 [candidate division GN15 bacterium]|uniref:Uncharacterized protein n=1 Tax=candidate division GN15 bacterium TaxID=2072418 RepID=A0A855X411_9BACT|nr:MAG: hypothetical protein C3F09_10710 [candidate division GN15 bacterium]